MIFPKENAIRVRILLMTFAVRFEHALSQWDIEVAPPNDPQNGLLRAMRILTDLGVAEHGAQHQRKQVCAFLSALNKPTLLNLLDGDFNPSTYLALEVNEGRALAKEDQIAVNSRRNGLSRNMRCEMPADHDRIEWHRFTKAGLRVTIGSGLDMNYLCPINLCYRRNPGLHRPAIHYTRHNPSNSYWAGLNARTLDNALQVRPSGSGFPSLGKLN